MIKSRLDADREESSENERQALENLPCYPWMSYCGLSDGKKLLLIALKVLDKKNCPLKAIYLNNIGITHRRRCKKGYNTFCGPTF